MVLAFFRIGWLEALLILAVIILVFGTSRFAQLKNSFVKAVKNFRQEAKGGADD
ncbi:MAG: twin-arginine translocase TatA/TatE family subunit [Bacillota bacterium]|jgi:TatA/E family protein of Tat protein translocase